MHAHAKPRTLNELVATLIVFLFSAMRIHASFILELHGPNLRRSQWIGCFKQTTLLAEAHPHECTKSRHLSHSGRITLTIGVDCGCFAVVAVVEIVVFVAVVVVLAVVLRESGVVALVGAGLLVEVEQRCG